MSARRLRYQPDEWAHDLGQWWAPLASLAARADCTSGAWLNVLGVEEFFDYRLLDQPRVLTPWLCVTAAAVAASAARTWAQTPPRRDGRARPGRAAARALAASAFGLACSIEEHRWRGRRLGEGVTSTAELIETGRAALGAAGHAAAAGATPVAVHLVAGWLVRSGGGLAPPPGGGRPPGAPAGTFSAQRAVAEITRPALVAGPLACGTAHLVERLAARALDTRPGPGRPDDPPAQAWANVLLVAEHGHVGLFEGRRQRSLLTVPPGTVVPDLARMAFIHASDDFLGAVADAFTAASTVGPLDRDGELVSWSLQLPGSQHPLAERTVSGRSAGLGAYVTFRSLSQLGLFAARDAAFTGQVSPDGTLGTVQNASGKIGAAAGRGIRLIVHPGSQHWRDPGGTVELLRAERAEDAVIAAAEQLRGLRSYLEAACRLVAPEPWLRTWLDKQGYDGAGMPLLTVMCRHLPPPRGGQPGHPPVPRSGGSLAGSVPAAGTAGEGWEEPDLPPCPAHLLTSSYPSYSFAVSADAGGGITMAAKRMVAEAARRALDCLRALDGDGTGAGFTLPLYAQLSELPATWDELIRVAVEALPAPAEHSLEIAAALASALRTGNSRGWRPLVVVDGTDRARRGAGDSGRDRERDFVALVTSAARGGGAESSRWRPGRPPQVVLCGRHGSPSHLRAAEALRNELGGAVATMGLDPLTGTEIDRFAAWIPGGPAALSGAARDLAANPLLLTLSIIAGGHGSGAADGASPTDLFDRGISILLGKAWEDRRFLAEIAFRAAAARNAPAGEFTLSDLAAPEYKQAVERAQADDDTERVWAMALSLQERAAFERAAEESHLLTASGNGWRFFHDRAFAFLVADRIARHAAAGGADDDELFGVLGPHLGDPLWTDVVEATGRLLELHGPADGGHC